MQPFHRRFRGPYVTSPSGGRRLHDAEPSARVRAPNRPLFRLDLQLDVVLAGVRVTFVGILSLDADRHLQHAGRLGNHRQLPADMRARFVDISRLIEEFGLEQVREPHVKHIRSRLWEMRMKGRDGISRALYVTAIGQRVVVVRVFLKKTQKTPNREIDLALKRAKELSQ